MNTFVIFELSVFAVKILLHKLRKCARVVLKLEEKKKEKKIRLLFMQQFQIHMGYKSSSESVCITSPPGVFVWKVQSRKHIRCYQKKLSEQDRTKWGDAPLRAYGLVYIPPKNAHKTLLCASFRNTQLKLWHMHMFTQLKHWYMNIILLLQHSQQEL